MRAKRPPTGALPKQSFLFTPAFSRSVWYMMWYDVMSLVARSDEVMWLLWGEVRECGRLRGKMRWDEMWWDVMWWDVMGWDGMKMRCNPEKTRKPRRASVTAKPLRYPVQCAMQLWNATDTMTTKSQFHINTLETSIPMHDATAECKAQQDYSAASSPAKKARTPCK